MSDRWHLFQKSAAAACLIAGVALAACAPVTTTGTTIKNAATAPARDRVILADFESPDETIQWEPLANAVKANVPATTDTTPIMRRGSLRPQAGLWSMSARLDAAGEVRRTMAKPLDLQRFDVLTAQVAQAGAAARNGAATAAIVMMDADGKRVESDAYPVVSEWRGVSMDLATARDEGLDLARIAAVGVLFRPAPGAAKAAAGAEGDEAAVPLTVQTDSWTAGKNAEIFVGNESAAKGLYVHTEGTRVHVNSPGQFDLTLFDRGARVADSTLMPRPWMEVVSGKIGRRVLGGGAPSGLMLLDSDAYQALADFRGTGPDDGDGKNAGGVHTPWQLPATSWPATLNARLTQITWQVVWASPVAAILEGKQENGPYDRLGEPAVQATWRLMIYQGGQVYVHVEWSTSPEQTVPEPITWALVQDDHRRDAGVPLITPDTAGQQRLLEAIYPAPLRLGLATALPHRMQTDAPVAMIARTNAQKNTWWWASGKMSQSASEYRRYFGAGIVPAQSDAGRKRADCMLLVNGPDAVTQAASFGQYLVPPKVVVRQGELDLTYPGDIDKDGFVEPYGFQTIRLENGRSTFTLYPQERPIFYPAFLFTVPAAERDTLDLKHSRMLITIDGKLFDDPPQFPDGSFLLQIPYIIDKPVGVEAIVVKR